MRKIYCNMDSEERAVLAAIGRLLGGMATAGVIVVSSIYGAAALGYWAGVRGNVLYAAVLLAACVVGAVISYGSLAWQISHGHEPDFDTDTSFGGYVTMFAVGLYSVCVRCLDGVCRHTA